MDAATFIQLLHRERLVMDYMFVFAVSIFLYDYLLTLNLEIKLIWFSPWSYTKILFLVFRYTSFALNFLLLRDQLSMNLSVETCKVSFTAVSWLLVLQGTLAEIILSIRTWAIWGRSKSVGILLVISIIGSLVAQFILLPRFIHAFEYAPPPYPEFRGCFVTKASTILWGNYTSFTVIEALFLTLMAISAFQSYRQGNLGRLSLIIHRDGILFYVAQLCVSVVNVAVVLGLPLELMFILTPLESVLYAVFTARIILNIRHMGNRSLQTELHTVDEEPGLASPLQFVRHIGGSQSVQESTTGGDSHETSVAP